MQNQKLSAEQINAFIEQQIVNGRILSLKHAQKLASIRASRQEITPVEQLVSDAAKINAYIMNDLDAIKKKSSLVLQSQMPPPGAFKPGA